MKPDLATTPKEGVRRHVRSCLRSARTARRVEAVLIASGAFALVLAVAVRSARRELLVAEWWLAGVCAVLGAVAWLVARRVEEAEVVSRIDDELGVEGEWRTAWEVETGRLPRTPLAEALVRHAPQGITRADLRDVVQPAALPLLALPFLAGGLYAVCLDQVRDENRREFEWGSVSGGLDSRGMRSAMSAGGAAALSADANEKFQEAIRAGAALSREMTENRADPEAVRQAVVAHEEALKSFEEAAERDGALTPEVEAALAERHTMLDAARLQLAQAGPEPKEGPGAAEGGGEIDASPSLAEGSAGTMPGSNDGAEVSSGPGALGAPGATETGGATADAAASNPPERRSIPPVLPGRSYEARYDGVVSRFVQSMTSQETD